MDQHENWKNFKSNFLFELDQFMKKNNLQDVATKVKDFYEGTKKEITHLVHEKDISKVVELIEKEKKDVEKYLETKMKSEMDRVKKFIDSKKDDLEKVQKQIENLTGINPKKAIASLKSQAQEISKLGGQKVKEVAKKATANAGAKVVKKAAPKSAPVVVTKKSKAAPAFLKNKSKPLSNAKNSKFNGGKIQKNRLGGK